MDVNMAERGVQRVVAKGFHALANVFDTVSDAMESIQGRIEASERSEDEIVAALDVISPDEQWAILDRESRAHFDISGEEFVEAWESGAFDDAADRQDLQDVALLIPRGR